MLRDHGWSSEGGVGCVGAIEEHREGIFDT